MENEFAFINKEVLAILLNASFQQIMSDTELRLQHIAGLLGVYDAALKKAGISASIRKELLIDLQQIIFEIGGI